MIENFIFLFILFNSVHFIQANKDSPDHASVAIQCSRVKRRPPLFVQPLSIIGIALMIYGRVMDPAFKKNTDPQPNSIKPRINLNKKNRILVQLKLFNDKNCRKKKKKYTYLLPVRLQLKYRIRGLKKERKKSGPATLTFG